MNVINKELSDELKHDIIRNRRFTNPLTVSGAFIRGLTPWELEGIIFIPVYVKQILRRENCAWLNYTTFEECWNIAPVHLQQEIDEVGVNYFFKGMYAEFQKILEVDERRQKRLREMIENSTKSMENTINQLKKEYKIDIPIEEFGE